MKDALEVPEISDYRAAFTNFTSGTMVRGRVLE
jgi:hypothetical protein